MPSASRRRRASWARFSQRRAETNFRLGKWRGYTPFAQETLVSHARDNIRGSLKRATPGVVSGTLGQLGGFPPFWSAGFRQERVEFSAVEPMAPGGRCREAHGMTARALIYLID